MLLTAQVNQNVSTAPSIWNQQNKEKSEKFLSAGVSGKGLFPVVVVKVNGITMKERIDSGTGSLYASAKLISLLHLKPCQVTNSHSVEWGRICSDQSLSKPLISKEGE